MRPTERSSQRLPRTIDVPLRRTGLFSACTRRELCATGRRFDGVEVDAGVCIQELQPLHWVYVVVEGILAVSSGSRAFVAGSESAVGARSALAPNPPSASITALTDSTILVTTSLEFIGLIGSYRGVALGVTRHLARQHAVL